MWFVDDLNYDQVNLKPKLSQTISKVSNFLCLLMKLLKIVNKTLRSCCETSVEKGRGMSFAGFCQQDETSVEKMMSSQELRIPSKNAEYLSNKLLVSVRKNKEDTRKFSYVVRKSIRSDPLQNIEQVSKFIFCRLSITSMKAFTSDPVPHDYILHRCVMLI